MLLYEGASCLQGRRSQLKGNYYASLYLHYRPADRGVWNYTIQVRTSLCVFICSLLVSCFTINFLWNPCDKPSLDTWS